MLRIINNNICLLLIVLPFIYYVAYANASATQASSGNPGQELILQQIDAQCLRHAQCPGLYNCEEGVCIHKSLFPMTNREIYAVILIMLLVGFAQPGGFGGSPIVIPILLAGFNYDTKHSMEVSFIVMFAGSLGNILANSQYKTHQGLPVINYTLTVLSLPLLMCSSLLGVTLNHLVPDSVICVLMICVLLFSIVRTWRRFSETREREQLRFNLQAAQRLNRFDYYNEEYELRDSRLSASSGSSNNLDFLIPVQHRGLQQYLDAEHQTYPTDKIRFIAQMLGMFVILTLLKGGKGMHSPLGIAPCSAAYWFINFVIVVFSILFFQSFANEIVRLEDEKERLGFNFAAYARKLDWEAIRANSQAAVAAGFVAGFLGMGGGVILTPFWMDLGQSTRKASSTATLSVVFTSFTTFIYLLLGGDYEWIELLFWAPLAMLSSYAVAKLLKWLMTKFKRESLLIAILLFLLCASVLALPVFVIKQWLEDAPNFNSFGILC